MTPQKATFLNLGISIIFAIAMIASSFFLNGYEHQETVTYLLMAIWFVPFSMLSGMSVKGIGRQL